MGGPRFTLKLYKVLGIICENVDMDGALSTDIPHVLPTHAASDWAPHHSPCCWSLFGVPEIQIHLFTLRSCEMALTGVSEISANESRAGQVPGRHSLDKEESPV